ncbi:MAG: hypothetical protein M1830_006773 [Pleopsidium flavum]|nr:MAG: hypothetical protein M1830_006773 [Pleopsidium flavum]
MTKGTVAAAVIIPILTLLGAFLLFLCYLKRRRNEKWEERPPSPSSQLRPSSSSNQHMSSTTVSEDNPELVPEMAERRPSQDTSTSDGPPTLQLSENWMSSPSKRISPFRLSGTIIDEESGLLESTPRKGAMKRHSKYVSDREASLPEFGFADGFSFAHDDWTPFVRPTLHNPRKRPSSRLPPPDSSNGSPSKRYSRTAQRRSDMSFKGFSRTSSKRTSGIGHGQSGFSTVGYGNVNAKLGSGGHGKGDSGPLDYGIVKPTVPKTTSLISSNESGYQDGENLINPPNRWPIPPSENPRGSAGPLLELSGANRASIRSVTTPRQALRLSQSTARQSTYKNRAHPRTSTNPFFSANVSSRASSHSHSRWDNRSTIASPSPAVTRTGRSSIYPSDNNSISRHPTQKTYQSYSRSSSLKAPLSPRKRGSFTSFSARIEDAPTPLTRSPHKSKTSIAGSSGRFESAPSSAHSGEYTPTAGNLGEYYDDDGSRKWYQTDRSSHPNPLGNNPCSREVYSPDSDGRLMEYALGETPRVGVSIGNRGSRFQRLSLSHLRVPATGDGMGGSFMGAFGVGEGSAGGGGGARLVGNKGKRASVEAGQQGSKSVSANVENARGMSAFI